MSWNQIYSQSIWGELLCFLPRLWGLLYSLFPLLLFLLLHFFPNLLFLCFILQQMEVNFTKSCFTFSFCQDRLTKLSRKGLSLSFCLLSLTLTLCKNIWQSTISVSSSSTKSKLRSPKSLTLVLQSAEQCHQARTSILNYSAYPRLC